MEVNFTALERIMFDPELYPLIYFDKKLDDYLVVGQTEPSYTQICPFESKEQEVEICLLLTKIYAAKKEYFEKEEIPLTHESYIKKYPKPLARFIPKQDLSPILDRGYEYTTESIKAKKEKFLIGLSCEVLDFIVDNQYMQLPYHLIALTFSPLNNLEKQLEKSSLGGVFYNKFANRLWTDIVGEEEVFLMTIKEYKEAFTSIELAQMLLRKDKPIGDIELLYLNNAIGKIPPRRNPLIDFAYSFFDAYLLNLEKIKAFKLCPVCNKAFKYKYNQIYCNIKCAKKKHHARYYSKHRLTIIPKARERMKELREYYHQKGIVK